MSILSQDRRYFAFFKSYFDAIDELPKKYQLSAYHAICLYALTGVEDKSLSGVPKSLFISLKPALDNNRKKSVNALKKSKASSNGQQGDNETQADGERKGTETSSVCNRSDNESGYKRENRNNSYIVSLSSSKSNIKGKDNSQILRDNSPEKYSNDATW